LEVWLRRRRRRFGFSDFRFEAAAATLSGTGSASPRPDRNSWLRGATACFHSGISGWFSLSLNPFGAWVPKKLARRSLEVWLRRRRRRFGFSDFRFEAAAATLSGTGSASPRPDRNSWLRGATACFHSGISGWFSLSLNPFGAWVPKKLARRSLEVWLRRRRRRFGFSDFRFEAAAATLSGTGSASPRPDRNSWLRVATACFHSGISG